MFNLSGSELIVIALLALVVLGPEKLPGAIRRFGRVYAELRRISSGFEGEFRSMLDDTGRPRPGETGNSARRASIPSAPAAGDASAGESTADESTTDESTADESTSDVTATIDNNPDETTTTEDGPDETTTTTEDGPDETAIETGEGDRDG